MANGKAILDSNGKRYLNASGEWDICEACCTIGPCNCTSGNVSDPRCKVTLSWSNASITSRDFLGCTWSNGESKEVCPDTYVANATKEDWRRSFGSSQFTPSIYATDASATQVAGGIFMLARTTANTYTYSGHTYDVKQQTGTVQASAFIEPPGAAKQRFDLDWKKRRKIKNATSTVTTTPSSSEAVGSRVTTETIDFAQIKTDLGGMQKPTIQDSQFGQITVNSSLTGETITIKWERIARADANPSILTTTTVTPDYWKSSAP